MTKLGLLCDRLMEAGWLFLVAAIPLYFNVYSNRVFEPDKITVLRCLALVMAAAYFIGWVERSSSDARSGSTERLPSSLVRRLWLSLRGDVILAATVALVIVSALATLTSIAPHASLWGSYQRLQGLYTLISFVVVFLVMRQRLRTRAQIDRLIAVTIITTVPIALYGILQHLQLDPLPWLGDTTFRVTSTMGNAIFLAAYLGMVVPLTAARLIGAVQQLRQSSADNGHDENGDLWPPLRYGGVVALQALFLIMYIISAGINPGLWWGMLPAIAMFVALTFILPSYQPTRGRLAVGVAGLSLVLLLQLAVVFLTQSRGPWLGVGAGLVCLVVIVGVILGSRRLLFATAAVSIALVVALGIFNLPNSPLAPLRSTPYIGRLGSLLESSTGTGRVRVLIWQGVGELMTTLPGVGLGEDRLRVLRPLLGYGPETMFVAFNKVYQPELGHLEARTASPDRSHNDLMDYLVTTGLAGLLSYLALLGAVLAVGWRALRRDADLGSKIMVAGVLSALVSHFVESQFGIVIVSTRTLFWVYAATVVSFARLEGQVSKDGASRELVAGADVVPTAAQPRLQTVAALLPGTGRYGDRGRKGKRGGRKAGPDGVSAGGDSRRTEVSDDERNRARVQGLRWVVAYMFVTMAGLMALSRWASVSDARLAIGVALLWVLVGLVAVARSLEWRAVAALARYRWLWVYAVLVFGVGVGCLLNVNVVAADVYYKRGLGEDGKAEASTAAGRYGDAVLERLGAVMAYRQALELSPDEDYYYLFLGRSYLELAKLARSKASAKPIEATLQVALSMPAQDVGSLSKEDLLGLARVVLEEAHRLNPLNTDHSANLARLYRTWSDLAAELVGAHGHAPLLAIASDYYRQATTLSPRSAQLLCEWAQIELARGEVQSALEKLKRAEGLDAKFVPTFVMLGDAYQASGQFGEALQAHARALKLEARALADQRFEQRVQMYVEAGKGEELAAVYAEAVAKQPESGLARGTYGYVLSQLGRLAEAVRQFEIYAELSPRDWMAHRNLALTYRELGRKVEALAAAERALRLAPPSQVPAMQDLVSELQKSGED